MYLCFNVERNELYHSYSVRRGDDILFSSYNENGWKKNEQIFVPNTTFCFIIESNFGYKGRSYLRFRAKYNGIELKNYESEENLRSKSLLNIFDVNPESGSWDDLFSLIEKIYRQRNSWNFDSYSNCLIHFCTKYKEPTNRVNNITIVKMVGTLMQGAFDLNIVNNLAFAPYLNILCAIFLEEIRNFYINKEGHEDRIFLYEFDVLYQYLKETKQQYLLFK